MKKIFDKLGWTGIVLIIAFVSIFIWGKIRHNALENNSVYVKGVSLGIKADVRGSMYLYYTFSIEGTNYKGHATTDLCKECNCCDEGDSVIIRFQKNNPENNDLVTELPKGASLEDNN